MWVSEANGFGLACVDFRLGEASPNVKEWDGWGGTFDGEIIGRMVRFRAVLGEL